MDNRRPSRRQQLVLCPLVIDSFLHLTLSFLFSGFHPDLCSVTQNGDYVRFRFIENSTLTIIELDMLQGFRLWMNANRHEDYVEELNAITRATVRDYRNGRDHPYVFRGVRHGRYYPATEDEPSVSTAMHWTRDDADEEGDDENSDEDDDDNRDGHEGCRAASGRRYREDSSDDDDDMPPAYCDHTYTRLR